MATKKELAARKKLSLQRFRERHPNYDHEYYIAHRDLLNNRAKERYKRKKLEETEKRLKATEMLRLSV